MSSRSIRTVQTVTSRSRISLRPASGENPKVETLLIGMRFVQYLSVMILFGAALLSAVVWLACETVSMSGDANGYRESGTILAVLNDTQFGRIWRWRLFLLAALSVYFGWRVVSGRKALTGPALLSGLVLTVSLAG